uniref:Serine/threonine-protein phosphatase 2A activator n=1 Tax=Wollemia nobilis TaxID=56998 RepID=A0A0C9RI51_9CONI
MDPPSSNSPFRRPDETTTSTAGTTTTSCCSPPPPPINHQRQMRAMMPNPQHSPGAFAPVPQACKVPLLSPPYSFQVPQKRISSPKDIGRFHQSESGWTFLGFVVVLSDSIRGHKISDPCTESSTVKQILEVLEAMNEWVDQIPPLQQPARYGNPAFRQWQERLQQEGPTLMLKILPQELSAAVIEIFPYFADSFGSAMRIDYGTGHEANFTAWLLCLARLGLIGEEDYQAVVSRVFVKYLDLMRRLQTTYWLEPAGSHGVWGLDDYHFLPFIFGSAQLVDHKYIKPKSIHNEDILSNFSHEYLYLSCVAFVKKVKKGPFAEHSPMLDDISGVAAWAKVNSGMLKMYKADVLEKVPIMQHFLFGSIIKWE